MIGPFDREHADAWSTRARDVETLNARVSDQLLRAIDLVRDQSRAEPAALRSQAILILGPAGAGKTHLFSRLRRKVGPRATFVLARPELSGDATPRHILTQIMDALLQPVPTRQERQLDLVVGSALARLQGQGAQWPSVFLEQLRSASAEDRGAQLADILEQIGALFPEADLTWLERLMAVPAMSPVDRRAALVWLSGREPDDAQLARLGLKEKLPESSVLGALRTLAFIASYSTPLMLVFDQLENLIDEDDPQDRRIHAHARLVSDFDTVRGLVIVQMALDAEWQRRIRPKLGASERSRLEARVEVLVLPSAAQRAMLVEVWTAGQATEPLPWPFTAAEWAQWQAAPGLTPRALMIACRRASERAEPSEEPVRPIADPELRPEDAAITAGDRLAVLWAEQLDRARAELGEVHERGHPLDAERLMPALYATLRLAPEVRAELGRPRQGFELRLSTSQGVLDVWLLQYGHPRAASAALDRIKEALAERACLALRERARPFPPTWHKVLERTRDLQAEPRGAFAEIDAEDIVRLLALHDLLAAARSRDLAGNDGAPLEELAVHAWVTSALVPASWPIVAQAIALARRAGTSEATPTEPTTPAHTTSSVPAAPSFKPPTTPSSEPPAASGSEPPAAPGSKPPAASGSKPPAASGSKPPARRSRPPLPLAALAAAKKTTPSSAHDGVRATLARLRLASLDRLVADLRALDAELTRAEVRAQLRALGPEVRWLGRSIVAWREVER